jgi:tetratricopeptide (TPR) repeat protein
MQEGDILVSPRKGGFGLLKILRIADFGEHGKVAHVMMYATVPNRPTLADLKSADVFVMHAPMSYQGLEHDCEILGNVPVERDELEGYFEYLKHTNFPQYAAERGFSLEELIAPATAAYDAANALVQQKQFAQAVEKYEEAINEFPFFFEAHDNRALTLMDLGKFREAIDGFSESLRLKSDNHLALFSLGECHLKLGEADEAVRIFRECLARWPDEPHNRQFLARAEALLKQQRRAKKPWWRFW